MKAIMIIGILGILLLAGCAQQVAQIAPEAARKGSASVQQIEINADTFLPAQATIDLVDAVEWINNEDESVKLIFHDGEGPTLEPGERYTREYSEKGTYTYSVLNGATGTIIVE